MRSYLQVNRFLQGSFVPYCSTGAALLLMAVSGVGCFGENIAKKAGDGAASAASYKVATPVVSSPAATPYYSTTNINFTGTCVEGNTLHLSGANISTLASQSVSGTCVGEAFSLNLQGVVDGVYNLEIIQRDAEANNSAAVKWQWVKDSTTPDAPTIASPFSPYYSPTSIVISGACLSTATVNLLQNGSPASTVVCANSVYSFTVTGIANASYTYTTTQTNLAGTTSAAGNAVVWNKDDTVPANVVVTSHATPYNSASTVAITGTCTSGFTVSLHENGSQLSTPAPVVCSSGAFTFATITNVTGSPSFSTHTYTAKQTSLQGVVSTGTAFVWNRNLYRTVALYHFNSAAGTNMPLSLIDSSVHAFNSLTMSSGYAANTTNSGKFSTEAGEFPNDTFGDEGSGAKVVNNASHASISSTLSAEAFLALNDAMSNGQRAAIFSKRGSSGFYGWEFGLKRISSGVFALYFYGTNNVNTSPTEAVSTNLAGFVSGSPGAFHHVAVTYNAGTVMFYYDGNYQSTSSALSSITTLVNSTGSLAVGASASSTSANFLDGYLDEGRISNMIRYTGTSTYTQPVAAFGPQD